MSKLRTANPREAGELFRWSRLCWKASDAVDVERSTSPLDFRTCDLLRFSEPRLNELSDLNLTDPRR